jgi:hypothetical protein
MKERRWRKGDYGSVRTPKNNQDRVYPCARNLKVRWQRLQQIVTFTANWVEETGKQP